MGEEERGRMRRRDGMTRSGNREEERKEETKGEYEEKGGIKRRRQGERREGGREE